MQNLILRALSGSVYVALIIAAIFWIPNGAVLLAALLGSFALLEWQSFDKGKQSSREVSFSISIFLLSLYIFSPEGFTQYSKEILTGIAFALFIWQLSRKLFSQNEAALHGMFHSVFGLVYIVPALVLMTWLGDMPWILMGTFILIWSNDSFAYLVGRFLGRTPFVPKVSPKKTWEGFAGGLLFSLGAAYLMHDLALYPGLNLIQWLGLAVLVVITASLGDLIESALKRKHNLKDSGNFIPGHGGILDRIDSLVLVMPSTYLYLKLIAL